MTVAAISRQSLADAAASRMVRQVNGIVYRGEPARGGILWSGGAMGGDVWMRPGKRSRAFDFAAMQAQEWAAQHYEDCLEFIDQFEAEMAKK